jgi:outer membrane protein, multidrug efflux system
MRALAVALGLTVASCAMGPDFHRPSSTVSDQYRFAPPGTDSTSLGDSTWWGVYDDPKLRELIATALRNNFDVKTAVARIEEAQASLGASRLALLPTIDGHAVVSRDKRSADLLLPGEPRIANSSEVAVTMSYELDFWGRLRRANESARATLLSSQYARNAVVSTLVAEVANGYFTLLSLDSQLEITKRTVDTREKFVQLTREQHSRGYATGLDVDTAEGQAAAARATVPALEREIGQQEDQLGVLLGGSPQPIDRQRMGEAMPRAPPLPPPGLPSQLLERRPDVREAEEALHAANADIGVAKAALFPTISLTGLAGSLSTPLGNLFKASTAEWSVAAGAIQPLLDSQRSIYQVQIAQARTREALFQYQKTVQTAFQEVADALLAYAKDAEVERELAKQVEAERGAQSIALARYRVGYASYFDVINADRDLFTAELALTQAYGNSLSALVSLYQALGGGWQDVPTAP